MPDEQDINRAISQNVEDGLIEIVGVNEDGDLVLRLTVEGVRQVEQMATERGVDLSKLRGVSLAEFLEAMGS